MTTQIETFTEVTSFSEAMRRMDADADNDKRADNEPPERVAEKIVSDFVDWLLVIAVSPDSEKNRRTKMSELLREFTEKIQPHAKLYVGKGADASKAATDATAVKVEAKMRRMATDAGVSAHLTENIVAAVSRMVANGDHDAPRKAIADLVEVCRKCGIRGDKPLRNPVDFENVNSYADAISAMRS